VLQNGSRYQTGAQETFTRATAGVAQRPGIRFVPLTRWQPAWREIKSLIVRGYFRTKLERTGERDQLRRASVVYQALCSYIEAIKEQVEIEGKWARAQVAIAVNAWNKREQQEQANNMKAARDLEKAKHEEAEKRLKSEAFRLLDDRLAKAKSITV